MLKYIIIVFQKQSKLVKQRSTLSWRPTTLFATAYCTMRIDCVCGFWDNTSYIILSSSNGSWYFRSVAQHKHVLNSPWYKGPPLWLLRNKRKMSPAQQTLFTDASQLHLLNHLKSWTNETPIQFAMFQCITMYFISNTLFPRFARLQTLLLEKSLPNG